MTGMGRTVGKREFRSKAALIRFVSEILNRYELCERLNADDDAFVCELFRYHPAQDRKLAGHRLTHIEVHPFEHGSRCFFAVRSDGTWTHFSYKKCVDTCFA